MAKKPEPIFPAPNCEVCGSPLYLEELLGDPERDVRLIDFSAWTCLQCDEVSYYEWDHEVQEIFRSHADVLRAMARAASAAKR